ncbi:MAG: vWA domain-containing protein [Pseudomonadota bacterium]
MKLPRRGSADTLSVSALDLFASALGVFVVMFIILMPFYLKRPSVEVGLAGAEARLAEAEVAMAEAAQGASSAKRRLATAEDALGGMAIERKEKQAEIEELKKAMATAQAALAERPEPQTQTVQRARRGGGNIAIERLDLVIVVDTTGSMGAEIQDLQQNLTSITRILNRLSPDLRLGMVAYRDRDSPPLIRSFPLAPITRGNMREMQRFARSLSARGGGDDPEPVDRALDAALDMPWRGDANGRIIVIGDAPAHGPNQSRSFSAAAGFYGSGPGGQYDRRVSAIVTGPSGSARAYFDQLAGAGGGDVATHRGAMIESVLMSVLR